MTLSQPRPLCLPSPLHLCAPSRCRPPSYIAQNPDKYPGASTQLVDYVFPHFTGIFAMTTVYMLLYSAVKRNNPALFPTIVLPGFISGAWLVVRGL